MPKDYLCANCGAVNRIDPDNPPLLDLSESQGTFQRKRCFSIRRG
jgi:hypothetical protein